MLSNVIGRPLVKQIITDQIDNNIPMNFIERPTTISLLFPALQYLIKVMTSRRSILTQQITRADKLPDRIARIPNKVNKQDAQNENGKE